MCTSLSSVSLIRARQCPCGFPFLGCIADAAGRGDPCTAEEAIASYKAPSTPVYHSCSFASPPGKGKFGMSANSPLSSCQLLTFQFLASAPRPKNAFNSGSQFLFYLLFVNEVTLKCHPFVKGRKGGFSSIWFIRRGSRLPCFVFGLLSVEKYKT